MAEAQDRYGEQQEIKYDREAEREADDQSSPASDAGDRGADGAGFAIRPVQSQGGHRDFLCQDSMGWVSLRTASVDRVPSAPIISMPTMMSG